MSIQDERWIPGKVIAEELGTTRNAILEQLYDWWLRIPGTELPERPPPEVIERAFEEWRARRDGTEGARP